ncbi:MAG: hypothetical protein HYT61_01610 [Candidatus Yanofskybacteria bacterium]|nr:hypothetical protein [Candidatus Yanofskybacteria bacterium]
MKENMRRNVVAFLLLLIFALTVLVAPTTNTSDGHKVSLEKQSLKKSFQTWKTIRLGTGLYTAGDFRKALANKGFVIGHWSDDAIEKPAFAASISREKKEVELVKVTAAELGFKTGATRGDIYGRAIQLGLKLSPAEVGAQLRLQYPDQPHGEWLLIAMEPIEDSSGGLGVAEVGHGGHGGPGLWLCGDNSSSNYVWPGFVNWIFVRSQDPVD